MQLSHEFEDTHLSEDLISMEPAMYARQILKFLGTQHFKGNSSIKPTLTVHAVFSDDRVRRARAQN